MAHKKTLKQFIEDVGDGSAADLFKVKARTVASWRRGERTPRGKQARVIVEATARHPKGPVTMDGIYA